MYETPFEWKSDKPRPEPTLFEQAGHVFVGLGMLAAMALMALFALAFVVTVVFA